MFQKYGGTLPNSWLAVLMCGSGLNKNNHTSAIKTQGPFLRMWREAHFPACKAAHVVLDAISSTEREPEVCYNAKVFMYFDVHLISASFQMKCMHCF